MKKIKIVKCSNATWWYKKFIGQTFEVEDEIKMSDGMNYVVEDPEDSYTSYVLASDAVEVIDEAAPEPRLYEHEGKQYILPEWAKFVTRDGPSAPLLGWEKMPVNEGKSNFHVANFQEHSLAKRGILKEHIKPLPEGAFIVEV